jgi:hypothetical protein
VATEFRRVALNTGHTQKNDAVSIAFTIETAPLFCVYPVFEGLRYGTGFVSPFRCIEF